MKISSFDIFDTCLVRKCGTPEGFFDVLSLRAFSNQPHERERQEFVAARILAQNLVQSIAPPVGEDDAHAIYVYIKLIKKS